MSTSEVPFPWLDRVSDYLNPILIKEARQSLKSRQFIATFMLLLVASWAISVFCMLMVGPDLAHAPAGQYLFPFFCMVLDVAIYIVVPFGAFRSLLSERDQHTFEALSISTLTPRQVIWGKFLSAVLQLFIYCSAITPFVAFTYLLKGIDIPTIAYVLAVSVLWSMALSMAALTISTFAHQRHWQVLLTLMVVGGLIVGFAMSTAQVGAILIAGIPFDQLDFWIFMAVILSYGLAYFFFCLQIAVTQLTFDADNRSTGVRIATTGIFWMTIAWSVGLLWFHGMAKGAGAVEAVAVYLAVHWGVIGLFLTSEPDVLSRRVQRGVSKSALFRLLQSVFMPGGSRGLLLVSLHLAVLCWLTMIDPRLPIPGKNLAVATSCYVFIYLSINTALARWGRAISSEFRPAHARVITLLGAVVGIIFPSLFELFNDELPRVSQLLYILNPFSTLALIEQGSIEGAANLPRLQSCVAVGIVVNIRAMYRGVADIVACHTAPGSAASASSAMRNEGDAGMGGTTNAIDPLTASS